MLSKEMYYQVLKRTTLTSVDVVLRYKDKILLGKRVNEPAKHYWFVPGCRTGKGETQTGAINRVLKSETGLVCDHPPIHLGVFDHIYPNNFKDAIFGTHYVVNAYLIDLIEEPVIVHDEQHSDICWFHTGDIKDHKDIHPFTKNYIPLLESISSTLRH
jgi:colanic acid biosynthesis protein WcaH